MTFTVRLSLLRVLDRQLDGRRRSGRPDVNVDNVVDVTTQTVRYSDDGCSVGDSSSRSRRSGRRTRPRSSWASS